MYVLYNTELGVFNGFKHPKEGNIPEADFNLYPFTVVSFEKNKMYFKGKLICTSLEFVQDEKDRFEALIKEFTGNDIKLRFTNIENVIELKFGVKK